MVFIKHFFIIKMYVKKPYQKWYGFCYNNFCCLFDNWDRTSDLGENPRAAAAPYRIYPKGLFHHSNYCYCCCTLNRTENLGLWALRDIHFTIQQCHLRLFHHSNYCYCCSTLNRTENLGLWALRDIHFTIRQCQLGLLLLYYYILHIIFFFNFLLPFRVSI